MISISNKNNWRKISKEKRPWSGQRSSIQFSRPLAQSIIHRLNWTRKIRGILGFSNLFLENFSATKSAKMKGPFHRAVRKRSRSSRIEIYSRTQGKAPIGQSNSQSSFRDVPGAVLHDQTNDNNMTNNNNSPTEDGKHFYNNLPEPPPYKR